MVKKLEQVTVSLYSHEIRKDADLTTLNSIKLVDAWPFIRKDLEHEIGCCHFICIPYITEAHLYTVTSIFVQNDDCTNCKTFKPLGALIKNINKEKTNPEYLDLLEHPYKFEDKNFKFPHDSVKITLQDGEHEKKVRVVLFKMSRTCVPANLNFVDNVYLDVENIPDLKGKQFVYMITNVVMAKTIEYRVIVDISARIFHLGNITPIVFALEEFAIADDGKLTLKKPVTVDSKLLHWIKVYPQDELVVETSSS